MIITDKFVFLHFPKTGGSFIYAMLKKVHRKIRYRKFFINAPRCREILQPNLKRIQGGCNEHGTYHQIPEKYRSLPIISCVRNPFDRYASTYEYQNWLERDPGELEKIAELYPEFPNLSFERYLPFINMFDIQSRVYHEQLKIDIGMISYAYIQFYFKHPQSIIRNLNEAYIESDTYKNDMPEITFLRTENLNRDLYDVLLKFGYEEDDISFILKEEKIYALPGREKNGKSWKEYYTRDLIEYVRHKERFILKMYPEYAP
jgi:hypothetical protein